MIGRRDEELERIKALDLRAYAAEAFGYVADAKRSSTSSTLLRGPDGDKIIVARATDGHMVYFSTHDTADNGSIVDFAQKRGLGSLGDVRKALRPYLTHAPSFLEVDPLPDLKPIERDLVAVRARWAGMNSLDKGQHPYLNQKRGLLPQLLSHPRFAARVRTDDRANAVFVHLNRDGVCGFEQKNDSWTGFSKGGAKGLFASSIFDYDKRLLIAESAIDAISWAQINDHVFTRFVSLAGQVSPEQVELVRGAIEKLPSPSDGPSEVILAFDNDAAGEELAERFRNVFKDIGRTDLILTVDRPTDAKDWNEVLCRQSLPDLSDKHSPPPPGLG